MMRSQLFHATFSLMLEGWLDLLRMDGPMVRLERGLAEVGELGVVAKEVARDRRVGMIGFVVQPLQNC
jgi:hypothetical protein